MCFDQGLVYFELVYLGPTLQGPDTHFYKRLQSRAVLCGGVAPVQRQPTDLPCHSAYRMQPTGGQSGHCRGEGANRYGRQRHHTVAVKGGCRGSERSIISNEYLLVHFLEYLLVHNAPKLFVVSCQRFAFWVYICRTCLCVRQKNDMKCK